MMEFNPETNRNESKKLEHLATNLTQEKYRSTQLSRKSARLHKAENEGHVFAKSTINRKIEVAAIGAPASPPINRAA